MEESSSSAVHDELAVPPLCRHCGATARPNMLLFYDFAWVSTRMNQQHDAMDAWLAGLRADKALVVLEIGAGTAVPSVRVLSEDVARRYGGTLVRINKSEPDLNGVAGYSLPLGGLEAIDNLVRG
ncbi:MAG TPA: hypothetical protein VGO93_03765 [Candidatus Xenobia bacterium]